MTAPWIHWLGVALQLCGLIVTAIGLYRTWEELQPDRSLTRWLRERAARLRSAAEQVYVASADLVVIATIEAEAVVTPGLTGDYAADSQRIAHRLTALSTDMNHLASKTQAETRAVQALVSDVSSAMDELDKEYESRMNRLAFDGLRFGAGGVALVAVGLLVAEVFRV